VLQPARSTRYTPFFQVLFTLQNAPQGAHELPGLKIAPPQTGEARSGQHTTAKFDLTFEIFEAGERLQGRL
jgi:hypothetical protein